MQKYTIYLFTFPVQFWQEHNERQETNEVSSNKSDWLKILKKI